MFKLALVLALILVVTCFKLANLASILGADDASRVLVMINESAAISQLEPQPATTIIPNVTTNRPATSATPNTHPATAGSSSTSAPKTTPRLRPTTPGESPASPAASTEDAAGTATAIPDALPLPPAAAPQPPTPPAPPDASQPDKTKPSADPTGAKSRSSSDLGIVFYSVFIVYVSFVKLIYHNVHMINHNLTEQGILMIFGILWQLVARKISSDKSAFPRFNPRIFFYLFLPSTVLESASMLSNKWLFFNLLPILTHSIIGTVLHASSLGFTIYSLARSNVFAQNWIGPSNPANNDDIVSLETSMQQQQQQPSVIDDLTLLTTTSPDRIHSDLSLAECLVFGTILSSIDAAPMLTVFKLYQVNEKLYYLMLGENLMNNAVVITIYNTLSDLFETTKLTVLRIYLATLQFFANLVGAVFIGFALALLALVSVRLSKRFSVPGVPLDYKNQCQAMVETLLIFKLAYLTYTLSNLAGTSSIVGLATYGILNDQYIKHNLNLRSQLAFKQVILGMKTMGFSLVYPLLGMLLVDTVLSHPGAPGGEFDQAGSLAAPMPAPAPPPTSSFVVASMVAAAANSIQLGELAGGGPVETSFHLIGDSFMNETRVAEPSYLWNSSLQAQQRQQVSALAAAGHTLTSSMATKKLAELAHQANLNWYFKFVSIVILFTVVYRFVIVISLGLVGNVLTCGQLKIKFLEQLLMAYGGFKGPLSMALLQTLMDQSNQQERSTRSKHYLFKYTVLMNIFISVVLGGAFIRPLVARIQTTLIGRVSTNLEEAANSTRVFDRVNNKLTEYISHGLNSVLGHSRSPYEKFIEFNETHIKPWLVRGGHNTNWLGVFYDNLIMDETLDANYFHIATEDPTTMRTFRIDEHRRRQRRTLRAGERESGANRRSLWRQRSSSVSILNTIDERLATPANTLGARAAPRRSNAGSSVALSAKKLASKVAAPRDREVLKEFVMFNLKLENARRRRQETKSNRQPDHQAGTSAEPGSPGPARAKFMIDSSSSNLSDSSQDRASRRLHLSQLEARLDGAKAQAARATDRRPHQPPGRILRPIAERARGGTFDRIERAVKAAAGGELAPAESASQTRPNQQTMQAHRNVSRRPV